MWAKVCLLKHLIGYWDHDLGDFDLQGEILDVALEYIYFIMGLSRQGTPINLKVTTRGDDPVSVQDYVNTYCMPGSQKRGSCVPIVHISNFLVQVLVSFIVRVLGYSSLHLATQNQMRIAVECLQGTVFDWCSGMIPIVKK